MNLDNHLSMEDRHAAFLAGMEYGASLRRDADITEAVQAALHQQSLEALGMARRHARVKGPNWEALVTGDSDE